jgi:hypothetical protein
MANGPNLTLPFGSVKRAHLFGEIAMAKYVRLDSLPAPPPPKPINTWIVALGIVPLVFALGFAMTGYINFWLGICIMSVAAFGFAISFWFATPTVTSKQRWSGVAGILAVYALTLWFVFVPAPIDVLIVPTGANYEEGSVVNGLHGSQSIGPSTLGLATILSIYMMAMTRM